MIDARDCQIETVRMGYTIFVRVTHLPSGAVGQSDSKLGEFRSRESALQKVMDSKVFKSWLAKVSESETDKK